MGASIWIGLVGLRGEADVLQGCPGAYSALVVHAADMGEFVLAADAAAGELGLEVEDVLWAEPLARRLESYAVEGHLLKIAEDLRAGDGGRFGTFHAWEVDD